MSIFFRKMFYSFLKTIIHSYKTRWSLTVLFMLGIWSQKTYAQENPINGADVSECSGFLVDSGLSAADYGNNENETITICAVAPETIVNLYWNICDLGNGDIITIYDGNTTGAPLIGSYTTNMLQSQDITSTNATGCLTVVFTSDGSDVGNFGAEISCGLPCEHPQSVITSDQEPMPLLICPGEEVTFNGSSSVFFNGTAVQSFTWVFDDGATNTTSWPSVSHVFTEPGGYKVQLQLTDNNNCDNNNVNDYIVLVSTPPNFDLISDITDLCLGGEAFLGITNIAQDTLFAGDSLSNWISEPWSDIPNADLGGDFCIEDGTGSCFNNAIPVNAFGFGEIVDQVSDIDNFFINFEHSFMGDLTITFICPNGQSINVHQQGGGGTYLGVPIDDFGGPCPVPEGVGWDYWWAPDATNGTWAAESATSGGTLPSDTYQSVQPWTNLLGCPLNGTWEIEICDLWGADDGNIFTWNVNFNPSLYGDLLTFAPVYGPDCDSTYWAGPNIVTEVAGCDYIYVAMDTPGIFEYTYYATNNFGCTYDTTITIEVDVAPTVTAGNDITIDCTLPNQQLAGGFTAPVPPGTSFVWQWSPAAGLANPTWQYTNFNGINSTTTYTLTGYPTGQPGCFSTDEVTVFVNSSMSIDVEEFYNACRGDTVHVLAPTVQGGTPPFTIYWESDAGQIIQDDAFNLTVTEPMEYCVIVADLCLGKDTACTSITAFPTVPATFHIQDPHGCEPHQALFTLDYLQYQDIESMTWFFDDGNDAATLASANHEYHSPGNYYPWCQIVDVNGCITADTAASPVIIWPTPYASFVVDPPYTILPNTTFDFNNETINGAQYYWNIAGLGEASSTDTSFTFPAETAGFYDVWLYAFNQYGCIDSTYRQAIVEDAIDVYIPNAFTPDNDGINDVWQIQGKGFQGEGFSAEIFNRWGELVYQSNDPTGAWTGNYRNGNNYVPDGVYSYKVVVRDIQNDINHKYWGSIVIVR